MILLDPAARPIIAHRGSSGRFPENTILAFEQGLANGADALELDVQRTADDVPVVIHDATLDRTTDGQGEVRKLTLRDLAGVDAGQGERIPTFDQVLERFPETPLIVELKEPGVGPVIATALRRHAAVSRVVVGSFHGRALRRFRPPFLRAASRGEIGFAWLCARFGWSAPSPRYDVFAVPERHGWIHLVDRKFVRSSTRAGTPVHVWTVNERGDGERLRGLGVQGIITDRPEDFRDLSAS